MSTSREVGSRKTNVKTNASAGEDLDRDSAALRVLGIAELVNTIFTFSSRGNNARNARVSKLWSEVALRLIWRKVVDLHPLFSILAPLTVDGSTGGHEVYSFAQLPSATRWRRFDKYATLVRTLEYTRNQGGRKFISRHVIRDVAQTRTRIDIFPNLRSLTWHCADSSHEDENLTAIPIPTDSFIFMHVGIKLLELYFPPRLPNTQIRECLDDIPQRMPLLTHISLVMAANVADFEDSINGLAHDLPSLQLLDMPGGFLTSSIAEALSALPALRDLRMNGGWDRPIDEPAAHFTPVIAAGRFPALKKLCVSMDFAEAAILIDAVTAEKGLHNLEISSWNPSANGLQHVLEICSNRHRKIRGLVLVCYDWEEEYSAPLTFRTLCSLNRLLFLTDLEIEHPSPILMTLSEFTSIISPLSRLSQLCFNQSPLYCETASFGLEVLPVIARSCRHLTVLKLFLDATLPLPDPERYPPNSRFEKLEYLGLGVSVITEQECRPVATFLSTLLPLGCDLGDGSDWISMIDDTDFDQDVIDIAQGRIELWEQVETLFSKKNRV